MRRVILSSGSCPVLWKFSMLSRKQYDLKKKKKKGVWIVFRFSLQYLSETFLTHKKKWGRYDKECLVVFK